MPSYRAKLPEMKRPIYRNFFLSLTIAFALTAVAGTLLHECGHYLVARALGYKSTISYAYTNWVNNKVDGALHVAYEKYGYQVMHHLPYPDQEKVKLLEHKSRQDSFWITLAGPLQTMLTGCLGLFLILIYRKRYASASSLSFWEWLPLFLSLFWTRQVFNFFIGGNLPFLKAIPSLPSDETKLSIYFNWPGWLLSAITALIGLLVSSFIVLKIVSPKDRTAFMVAGLVGGGGGFIIWIKWLGPMLLP